MLRAVPANTKKIATDNEHRNRYVRKRLNTAKSEDQRNSTKQTVAAHVSHRLAHPPCAVRRPRGPCRTWGCRQQGCPSAVGISTSASPADTQGKNGQQ